MSSLVGRGVPYPMQDESVAAVDIAAIAMTRKIYTDALEKALLDVVKDRETAALLDMNVNYSLPNAPPFNALAIQMLGMIQVAKIYNEQDLDDHAKTQE